MFSLIKSLKKKRPTPTPVTTDDLLGIEGIRNGILTRKGKHILILEIVPVNFLLKSEHEQAYIISCYEELLKIIKTDFQITTIARKADISGHLKYMETHLKAEQNEDIKRQIAAYMSFSKEVSGRSAISRRFILAIPYAPPAGVNPDSVTFETALSALLDIKGRVKQCLTRCGNGIVEPDNPDQFVAEILYILLNRKSSETQSLPTLRGGLL